MSTQITLAELRTQTAAEIAEPWEHRTTRGDYITADELVFVRLMASKGRRIVLKSMRRWVDSRRFDEGVDRAQVKAAVIAALEAK